jgi:type II secretory pathway component GspD/PulD (secretin)
MRSINRSSASNLMLHFAGLALATTGTTLWSSTSALAFTAGSASSVALPARGSFIDQCESLFNQNKLVQLRETLVRVARNDNTLSAEDQAKAKDLLSRVDQRLGAIDASEVSLQTAEMALSQGDLRLAERHAQGVASTKNPLFADRAAAVLDKVASRRTALAPIAASAVSQAQSDFAAGKYEQAKAMLMLLTRSGVAMDNSAATTVETLQLKINELEVQNGKSFEDVAIALSIRQPGTMRPEEAKKDAEKKTEKKAEEAKGEPVAIEPIKVSVSATPAPGAEAATKAEEPFVWYPVPPGGPAPVAAPAPVKIEPAPAPVEAAETPAVTMEPAAPAAGGASVMAPAAPAAAAVQPTAPSNNELIQLALKADAQRALAEADLAFDQGRYAEAASKYSDLLAAQKQYLGAEEIARAESRLAQARARIGSNVGGDLGSVVSGQLSVLRDKAVAEYENEMQQAKAAMDSSDFARARSMVAKASSTVERNAEYLNATDRDAYLKRVDQLKKQIDTKDEATRAAAAADAAKKSKEQQETAQRNLKIEREKKIVESIKRARSLQQEQKYAEALQIVEQVLFLDQNDPTALLLRDVLQDLVMWKQYGDNAARRSVAVMQNNVDNNMALELPTRLMQFPEEWPAKTQYRTSGTAYSESPENQRALSSLGSIKIPAQFNDNSVADALAYVQKSTGLNLDVDWASLKTIGIDPETPITFNLTQDMPAKVVLEKILQHAAKDQYSRPDFAVENGMLNVASADAIQRKTAIGTYNITDLLLEVPDYTEAPVVDLQQILAGGKSTNGANPFRAAATTRMNERLDRSTRVRQIIDIVKEKIDPTSWRDNGGETGSIQELNGSLIIQTTPKNHREIIGLLSKLREIRSLQINVEARFLLVSQDFFEQIGINLNLYLNAKSKVVQNAQANDPSLFPSDFFDFTRSTGTLRRVLQSPTAGSVTPTAPGNPPTPASILQDTLGTQTGWSPIGVGQNSLGIINGLASGNSFATELLQSAPALGIAGQFLDDIQVDFLVRATQADRRNTTLTAPRLTFTNGQISNIYIVTQRAFISQLEPIVGQGAVGFNPTVASVPDGVTLQIEGVVSADRRYVTMNVDTAVTKLERLVDQPVTAVTGGQLVNSRETSTNIQLPIFTVTRVQTTSTVPDEGTLLLGGQRLVTEFEVESGVPVLSKLPILNRFFSNRVTAKQEQSLMILVKPTIIIQAEQEERAFPGLSDSIRSGMGR